MRGEPVLCQDWHDIDFAIEQRVDFIAVSFVKTADVIINLKDYIQRQTGSDSIEARTSFYSKPRGSEWCLTLAARSSPR